MQAQNDWQRLIFYVLPNQKVNLSSLSSKKIIETQIQHDFSSQGTFNALKYRYPLKYLGKQYSQLVVPCTPAKQPKLIQFKSQHKQDNQNYQCLVKVTEEKSTIGYASGKRSAILQTKNGLLRYKGCGNLVEGFPLSNNELRGCHYFHTLKRQLLMTRKINQILSKQIGIRSANISKFGYEFQKQQILKLNLKCEAQMIGKYCCVFQTIGDRRIGTHIISPLEVLFLNLCKLDDVNWLQLFQKNNRIDHHQPVQFLANWLFLEPEQTFLSKFLSLDSNLNYINLESIELQNNSKQKKDSFIEKVLDKLVKNQKQKKYVKDSLNSLSQNFKKIASLIVQKVGYEMGEIKRIFCDHSINWGYYNDHGALWHCNAHLNNFISTIPNKNSQFLLPLDFDLAFFRQEFISIDLDQQKQLKYGKYDDNEFENFLCCQYQAMQMSVSGIEVMSNFEYSIDYDKNKQISPLSSVKMARIVFRDSLLKSFRSGMRRDVKQKQRINGQWDQNIEAIKQIVKLCLIISQDFQT